MTRARQWTAAIALGSGLLAGAQAAQAQHVVPPWVERADFSEKAFAPLQPNVRFRPNVLMQTDHYAYGPGTASTNPIVTVTIDPSGYADAATVYLYHEDRDSGARLYYNLSAGWSSQERDLFGSASNVRVRVKAPDFENFRLFGPGGVLGSLDGVPTGVGQYQIVLEIRDANGAGVIARGNAMFNRVGGVVQVSGNINSNTTWTSNNLYFLATPVYVQSNAVLIIEPGTVILGSTAGQGTLIVRPGSRIIADGDESHPIVFSSEHAVGDRNNGDWGGLVISGNAPVNGGVRQGEGDSGNYGGNDPGDDSGILRYVRVEFGGIRFSEQNELNGIAFQGVGRGTTVEFIQIVGGSDDGMEFFGGTVDVKNVLVLNAEDDSFDWTFGWNGRAQFICVVQYGPANDQGIEADNDEDDNDLLPRSGPTIYNSTWIGNNQSTNGNDGWILRRGTGGTFRNFIIMDFEEFGILVDGSSSQALLGGELTIDNGIVFSNRLGVAANAATQAHLDAASRILTVNPELANPHGSVPDLTPLGGSPARAGANVADPPNDGFFENVGELGCTSPASWLWAGWLSFNLS